MRPRDRAFAARIEGALSSFHRHQRPLPGIESPTGQAAFVEQVLESTHRIHYIATIRARPLSDLRADPDSDLFDPIKAAILSHRRANVEEASWLAFLAVHFGKSARAGWRYAREVYGRLGNGPRWDWSRTSADPASFRAWLHHNLGALKRDGVPRGFGNHRKYQSLDAHAPSGTGAAVETYVSWVGPPRTHRELFDQALAEAQGDHYGAFDYLYRSMAIVASFGRTARFDYLTTLGKLGLAAIAPGSAYLKGATGPVLGARLLFGGSHSAPIAMEDLDRWVVDLGKQLDLGMQVIEDALCNWQKSPNEFKPFRL